MLSWLSSHRQPEARAPRQTGPGYIGPHVWRRPAPLPELPQAQNGHCGSAPLGGDCVAGSQGSWRLPVPARKLRGNVTAAVQACSELCLKCAQCNYISVSVRWLDCSWFKECDLREQASNFVSLRVRGNGLPPGSLPLVESTPHIGSCQCADVQTYYSLPPRPGLDYTSVA